ncbi:PREDICTED: DNA repair protein recA homolog 3, mitochondrial-like [Lupinus angustifolius]|uniref:DNA repair protein recA homolog 3, mitochondrial-like n=1 Tax=Lupinus angustifolius TaxID=3871 RepID=UPI00092F1364|nr:PREDICTED: DNA repair protein recA homolog 3, mitochondrial-like [Lupinus angustifolius]
MARLLRNASILKRSLFLPQVFKLGILGTSQILNYSSKGRKHSKSDGSDSGEENMSKKDLALQQALDQITSSFGKGSIMWLGRSDSLKNVPVVSTGSFALDIALGVGGLPKGRVVEIYGPEASGKTTLALHVIAEAQKHGGYCAFVDAEHALDKTLAESIGVNTENLLLSQPDCGEQALSLVDTLIRSGSIDVVVVDSVAALVPKGELDGEMGDAHMAMQARLMSQALRKLSHSLSLSQTILIFINQVRSKLSTFGGFGGPTEVTCGGNALKFYASMRLNIKRIGFVKKGEEILGSQVLVKVVKNKLAPPFKTAQFELEFGKGICREAEIIELSLKYKLISKAGSMYYYNDQNFRGKDALKNFLADNHSILAELEMKLREKLLNADTKKVLDSDVIIRDVTEEVATLDSTDEETAAIVEA